MHGRDLWKRRGPRASQSQASWLPTSDGDSALHTHTHTHPSQRSVKPRGIPPGRSSSRWDREGVERAHVVRSPGPPHHKARCRSHQRPHQTQVPTAPRITEIADAFIWLNALQPWGSHSKSQFWSGPSRRTLRGQRASVLEAPGSQPSGAGDAGCLQT